MASKEHTLFFDIEPREGASVSARPIRTLVAKKRPFKIVVSGFGGRDVAAASVAPEEMGSPRTELTQEELTHALNLLEEAEVTAMRILASLDRSNALLESRGRQLRTAREIIAESNRMATANRTTKEPEEVGAQVAAV